MIEVAMPAQPQASSSTTMHESSIESPTPAVLVGDRTSHESPSSQALRMIVARELARLVVVGRLRRDLRAGEAPRGLLQGELLVAETEIHDRLLLRPASAEVGPDSDLERGLASGPLEVTGCPRASRTASHFPIQIRWVGRS